MVFSNSQRFAFYRGDNQNPDTEGDSFKSPSNKLCTKGLLWTREEAWILIYKEGTCSTGRSSGDPQV